MAERELASDTLGLLKVTNEPAQFILPGKSLIRLITSYFAPFPA
jgi:hypothetical protein